MIRTRKKRAEALLVVGEAAERHAAEIDAVIGPRPARRSGSGRSGPWRRNSRARSSSRCRRLPSPNCRRRRCRAPWARARRSGRQGARLWDARSGRPARSRARPPAARMASTIGLRAWPALTHQRPEMPSRTFLPFLVAVVHALGLGEQSRARFEVAIRRERSQIGSRSFGRVGVSSTGVAPAFEGVWAQSRYAMSGIKQSACAKSFGRQGEWLAGGASARAQVQPARAAPGH